mmetsp:Transcript_30730/g.55746  ORF Transcript_30730/g.55746 Transcript_30730/m.55746 type:complete len:373 (-) Transcript_30730:797-1915(-)
MKLHVGILKLVELIVCALRGLLGLREFPLQLGFFIGLVHHLFLSVLKLCLHILRKGLIVLLTFALSERGLLLHLYSIGNQLLEHQQDAVAVLALLVAPRESLRCLLSLLSCRRLEGLQQRRVLLGVETRQDAEGFLQQGLRLALLGHHGLELRVLLLTVLRSQLLLLLDLLSFLLHGSNLSLGFFQLLTELLLLGIKIVQVALLVFRVHAILVELLQAILLLLGFIVALLLESVYHEVDLLLHPSKAIQLCLHAERNQPLVLLLSHLHQRLPSEVALSLLLCRHGAHLDEGKSLPEIGLGIVAVQDLNGLRHSEGLVFSGVGANLIIFLLLEALVFHFLAEGNVSFHGCFGILDVLLQVDSFLVASGFLLLL